MTKIVRAAGGVVVNFIAEEWVVLVTHRPRYDDWSLPKGKRDVGETDEACARREVLEETGLTVVMHSELPPAEYTDHRGRPKIVRYWLMTLDPAVHPEIGGTPDFAPNEEVDEVVVVFHSRFDDAGWAACWMYEQLAIRWRTCC